MFWPNIVQLKHFYTTPLGQVVCRRVRAKMQKIWPEIKSENVLGIGYAMPYLRGYWTDKEAAEHPNNVMVLLPPEMGGTHWPPNSANRVMVAEEDELPLPDASVERILIVHGLEFSGYAELMMHEAWRILAPGGKILVAVPHRIGIWSRMENTPFGHGHPYNSRQVRKLMHKTSFTPTQEETALFFPPLRSRLLLRLSGILEKIGQRCFSGFGGILLMEAEKQLYAVTPEYVRQKNKRRIYIPVTAPAMSLDGDL